jgi:hypothetical protein
VVFTWEQQNVSYHFCCSAIVDELEEGETLDVATNLAGVSTGMILLNKKGFPTMSDGKPTIPVKKGDAFWTEISEDPRLTLSKLWQLQCAFCALCEHEDGVHPKAAIVCLNGDKDTFSEAVSHIEAVSSAEVEEDEVAFKKQLSQTSSTTLPPQSDLLPARVLRDHKVW